MAITKIIKETNRYYKESKHWMAKASKTKYIYTGYNEETILIVTAIDTIGIQRFWMLKLPLWINKIQERIAKNNQISRIM